jgi:5-methylcytosine-specific restriction endonuclease McrA
MTQPDLALLLHCAGCGKNRPRGWFARSGEGRRTSWCRECRAPGRALEAAKRRGAVTKRMPPDTVRRLLAKQGWRCRICGGPIALGAKVHLDHRRPVSKGGRHEESNLRAVHPVCNMRRGNRT